VHARVIICKRLATLGIGHHEAVEARVLIYQVWQAIATNEGHEALQVRARISKLLSNITYHDALKTVEPWKPVHSAASRVNH
jgi:hypothetical protein